MLQNGTYGSEPFMVHYWFHGDFESKEMMHKYQYNDQANVHWNLYQYFKMLYPRST